ncbi:MAG: hypothetical protein IKC03_00765 [Oscillospiraceae bacterium]|nr:hypothetical protein [Oscillospiraceae bacterium]
MFFYTFIPKLFNMSLTASIAIVIVILLRLLLKKAPKIISYALWSVVLFRLLCPVSIGSTFSLYNLFDAPAEESGTLTSIIEYVPTDIVHTEYPSVVLPVPGISDAINEALPQGREQLVADPLEAPMSFATYVWMTGVSVMVIYSIASYIQLRRKLSVVVPLRDNILIADDMKSPVVVGLFRPRIYLPCHLNEREQEYIVLHEQYHIKRLDHITKALAFLALTIHWFNPLVWVAFILSSRDMEMSCDEAVIRKLGSEVRAEYCASLLTLATGRRIIAGTPLAFGEGDTKDRIHNLAGWKKPAVWVIMISGILGVSVAICLFTNPIKQDDYLRLIARESPNGKNQAQYEIQLGNQVMGGEIYVEQWSHGTCVRSSPMVINQQTEKVQIITSDRRENHTIVGTDIQIDTGKDGGLLTTYFPFPENNSIMGWAFTVDALNRKVMLAHGSEVILAAITFDEGNGVRVFSSETLTERVKRGEYMIVVRAYFSSEPMETQNTEPVLWSGELIPGTTYVPYQCLYMNPLSSYAAIGGDSGCKYIIGEHYFYTVYRNHHSIDTTNAEQCGDSETRIYVPNWEWQEFPYTDQEWSTLYILDLPRGFGTISNISERYKERLYLPLTENEFLLKMDDSLWLVRIANDPNLGTYLRSIYSLIPESAMGVAQWEFAPMLSSRSPVFRFAFDMEYTEISAVCTEGRLVNWETPGVPSDHSMTFQNGVPLCWTPLSEDGSTVTSTTIHFTVHQNQAMLYSGTIYIDGNSGSGGRRIYTAAIVGTGLHLDPNSEQEGGVISDIASPNATRVIKHDLTQGDLEVPINKLSEYMFYTNSQKMSVRVKGEGFDGQVNLLDISQNNAHILQAKVDNRNEKCLFTGLTAARLYRVDCENLDGCTVVISGDR